MNALRIARSISASAVVAGMLVGGSQLVLAPSAQAKATKVQAVTAVNVRSGPGTTNPVIGVLRRGEQVVQTGPARNGWAPVTYHGHSAWVYASYLSGSTSGQTSVTVTAATGVRSTTARTTEAVNLRTGPGTSFSVVRVLDRGETVQLTGARQGAWVQATVDGSTRWLHSGWLSTPTDTAPAVVAEQKLPAITGKARATTALMIRTTSDSAFKNLGDIAAGTVVELTGKKENGVAQIVWQGATRWVNARYLTGVASSDSVVPPKVPATTGSRFASVALDIRTSSGSDARTLSEVPAGTELKVTGVVQNGRAQVVWQGAVRWVTARYLVLVDPYAITKATTLVSGGSAGTDSWTYSSGGSSGLAAMTSTAQNVVRVTRANFPQIVTMYGVRSDPIPDHPSGHAVDLMIPRYRSNAALGWAIANYLRAHASELNIKYIIFHQQIWSVARDREGWRWMADRGGDTANHYDHVHITVN